MNNVYQKETLQRAELIQILAPSLPTLFFKANYHFKLKSVSQNPKNFGANKRRGSSVLGANFLAKRLQTEELRSL